MKEEKKNGGLVVSVVILSILVLLLGGYIVYDKVLEDSSPRLDSQNVPVPVVDGDNANQKSIENTGNNIQQKETIKYFYDVKDLKVKALSEYSVFSDISKNANVVEKVDFGFEKDYAAFLDLSGNVTVQKYRKSEDEKGITGKLNVTNVIDIVQFNIPSLESDQLLYLLTDSGNLYYYKIGDVEKNKFNATKVETVSNVKKVFISNYSKENAGGSWALFAITGNNDCIMINAESV